MSYYGQPPPGQNPVYPNLGQGAPGYAAGPPQPGAQQQQAPYAPSSGYPAQPGGPPAYGAPPAQGQPAYGQAPGYPPQGQYGQYPQSGPQGHGPPTGQPAYNPGYPQGPPQTGYPQQNQQQSQQYSQQPYQQPSYHGAPQGHVSQPTHHSGGGYGDASAPPGEYLACGNYPVGQPTAPSTWKRKPSPKLIISLNANNLTDRDITSKSDPMAVMFIHDVATQKWFEAGRTEAMRDSLDPDWQEELFMDYYFEECQKFRIEVYDKDSSSHKLKVHDFLGKCDGKIAELVAAKHGKKKFNLLDMRGKKMVGSGKPSELTIRSERKADQNNEVYHLQCSAQKLDDKDFFGKSDPYMEISRENLDGTWNAVHRTEVINNNLNPRWRPFELSSTVLCNNDRNRKLRFRVYDYDDDGSHDFIGEFFATVNSLTKDYKNATTFPCINEKKKKKKGSRYKNSGVVSINNFKATKHYSFLEYIGTGTQLNFIVAIDYTGSNGDPRDPNSLHYFDPVHQNNQYTNAIRAVGDIIQEYDSDKQFPAYGFGAKLPNGQVDFCFNVNLTPNPDCNMIDGVLYAYRSTLPQLQLWGPTNFSPIIRQAALHARSRQDGSAYTVLLILTDGAITDFEETKHEIVQASDLPMSIIIVGVGNADFDAMDDLDGDGKLLKSPINGQRASRDIVQFVPFRKFLGLTSGSSDFGMSNSRLAKEVLQEVPHQFETWMLKRGIQPIG